MRSVYFLFIGLVIKRIESTGSGFSTGTNNVLNLTFEKHFSRQDTEVKENKSWLNPKWFSQPTKSYDFVIDIPDTLTTINNPGW